MVERIKTYVRGLDEHLGGGIPKGHIVYLAGQPGTMKSSLAYYILYNNALHNEIPGVHISLEQNRTSLVENMAGLGMSDYSKIGKKISVLDLGFIRKKMTQLGNQTWMEVFKMYTQNLKKNMNYELLVLDSLPVLSVMAKFRDPREELFHFYEWLRDLEVTSFLIGEMPQDTIKFSEHGEDFLADGVVHLDLRREKNSVNLFLSIAKMRKSKHKRGYFPLIYDKKGFEIVVD